MQTKFSLTADERAEMDALAARLGAPLKSAVLAAVRAALIGANNGTYPAVREALLRGDLEPAKPGPKVAEGTTMATSSPSSDACRFRS